MLKFRNYANFIRQGLQIEIHLEKIVDPQKVAKIKEGPDILLPKFNKQKRWWCEEETIYLKCKS